MGMAAAAAAICAEAAALDAAVSQDNFNLAFFLFLHFSLADTGLSLSGRGIGNTGSGSLEGANSISRHHIMP